VWQPKVFPAEQQLSRDQQHEHRHDRWHAGNVTDDGRKRNQACHEQ
jgi:hypothetical protein